MNQISNKKLTKLKSTAVARIKKLTDVDSNKSVKEKEIILKFAKDNPSKISNLSSRKFRRSLVKGVDLTRTSTDRYSKELDKSIKKVDPKFDPHKYKKIGSVAGATTGIGTMTTLGMINPVLAATPGIGPASMSGYGLAIGTAIDKSRINKLAKTNKIIHRSQVKLDNHINSIKVGYKATLKDARYRSRDIKRKRKSNKLTSLARASRLKRYKR